MAAKAERKKSTKERLLESAALVFTEKGFANASVAEICELAGANIAAVNYHFRSKDALYRQVLEFTFSQAEKRYPMAHDTGMIAEERLYRMILALLQRILCAEIKGNFYKLVSKEMAEPTAASGDLIGEIIFRQCSRMQQVIQDIYGNPADDELLMRMTHSIISQCLFLGQHKEGRSHHLKRRPLELADAESFARHIADFSIAGIKYYRSLPRGNP
ncbi:MAG: CerR family C-terminal domain-containing protein [Deltaproteobacteria bacterium]|nr:CerR family C-terminal domain-containing protein [Candidatus Anaeroferrophillus wilburensis]MBN2888407.1 CerR family C-terminal domain-containing protein [Deltaproteobacteria bacterium]